MRTVRTGKTAHELVEAGQPTRCSACGHAFEPHRYTTTWRQCSCTEDESGHRVWICLLGPCRGATTVPPCSREIPNPLAGHDRG